MPDEILTGVEEQAPDAGGQEEEQDIFGLGEEEAGEENASDAGEQTVDEDVQDEGFKEKSTEKAFAARLAKEREKIAKETEDRLRQEYEARMAQQAQPQQHIGGDQPPPLSGEQLDSLADTLGVTREAAWAMYQQQWLINQQSDAIRRQDEYVRRIEQGASKIEALKTIEQRRKKNPYLPEPDEKVLADIRKDYKIRTGFDLPWEDAYDKLVARETESGAISRRAEQETIGKIAARNKATIQAGKGGQAKKPSIDDLSPDEFNKLVEDAKKGKYKKS